MSPSPFTIVVVQQRNTIAHGCVLGVEVEVGRKTRRKKTSAKRKTRSTLGDGRASKSFQRLLEEVGYCCASCLFG